ncbi:MAG: Hsp20/alpha crystallin family protein [Candidatus Peregrinibacteria bacterium]|nr:Hsp20/alpha crystallin family protein [Candidatus Peregrinibacteria bacterium]
MKPIGIGQLKKASKKQISRHDFQQTQAKDDPISPIAKNIPLQSDDFQNTTPIPEEQEGQLSVDVYQTDTEIIIVAPVAGSAPEEINISITEDVITIKGRREIPLKDTIHQEDFYIQECFWGNFSRSIVLPAEVDTNNVQARFKYNILTIRIPKTERVRTRIVKITHD